MATRLSEAQDSFLAAFSDLCRWDRGELLNRLELALDCDKQEPQNRLQDRAKANVLLASLDALSDAILAEKGEED